MVIVKLELEPSSTGSSTTSDYEASGTRLTRILAEDSRARLVSSRWNRYGSFPTLTAEIAARNMSTTDSSPVGTS
jgi:hypothetical protein